MSKELRTSIVIDYQNLHLAGHNLFHPTKRLPRHETLVDPLLFARQLLLARKAAQLPGLPDATMRKVLVFRGQPSPEHDSKGYARNQAQKAHWERDKRVLVTLRPLKYEYQRDATGEPATDALGRKTVLGAPREKGVDVLCALATVREAQTDETDLVILVSSDTDLAPTLDEVVRLGTAKIETACWWDSTQKRGFQLHPTDRSIRLWNTRLSEAIFLASRDLTDYT